MGRPGRVSGSGGSFKEMTGSGYKRSASCGSEKEMTGNHSNKRSGSGGSFKEMSAAGVRKHSESGGSHKEMLTSNERLRQDYIVQQVREWTKLILTQRSRDSGKSPILHKGDIALLSAYLNRCRQLDATCQGSIKSSLQEFMLTGRDVESNYTALHAALFRGDLAVILLLLWHASAIAENNHLAGPPMRLKQRPMVMLEHCSLDSAGRGQRPVWEQMVTARDAEGLTPGQLLALLQQKELLACRASLARAEVSRENQEQNLGAAGFQQRPRPGSFDFEQDPQDNDSELGVLYQNLRLLRREQEQPSDSDSDSIHDDTSETRAASTPPSMEYGCEVLTFGRAHHCALGVGTNSSDSGTATAVSTTMHSGAGHSTTEKFRPQRVPAFAQSEVGRSHGAIAVAAAAYHTMVLNNAGQVFVFGLGKGGRLGIGSERHCPMPTLVPLGSRRIVAVAAAETHSLVVTSTGQVWAWGSNRFGQCGIKNCNSIESCSLSPRRVDDLRDVFVRSVAAGERHSVALSSSGLVYVFGDNSHGQLGLPPRRQHNAKVQLVPALGQKNTMAVAASDFSTLALVFPAQDALPVNSIYAWGHGNHVPSKIHLQEERRARSNSYSGHWEENGSRNRSLNPTAIASAKYHNVAITDNGLVYTWGFHKETLGAPTGPSPSNKNQHKKRGPDHEPQLVKGMLPENGGGFVVAVSASENHTAVLTDTGALYTWGATYGPNILGHLGVRFQPDPKRVPGLYRCVAVAAAKEHFCVLMGASFPPILNSAASGVKTLEKLAAESVMKHVDLFNVLPILTTAERAHNEMLVRYCTDFIKRNLDGVLNVGQRSVMDCYLTEQLQTRILSRHLDSYERDQERDDQLHPFLKAFVEEPRKNISLDPAQQISLLEGWVKSCSALSDSLPGKIFLQNLGTPPKLKHISEFVRLPHTGIDENVKEAKRSRGVSFGEDKVVVVSKCSLRCLELVKDVSVEQKDVVVLEQRQMALMKEVRAVRKRLAQISKLESIDILSRDQMAKLDRKGHLEEDLANLEPALSRVEGMLRELSSEAAREVGKKGVHKCDLCSVTCSDEFNYSLHLNGRKHRNRIARAEHEEQARTAALVAAHHQAKSTKKSDPMSSRNPWITEPLSPVPPPLRKLPPPPHGVPSTLSMEGVKSTSKAPASLKDIMDSEARMLLHNRTSAKPKSAGPVVAFSAKNPTFLKDIMASEAQQKRMQTTTPTSQKKIMVQTPSPSVKAAPETSGGGLPWELKLDSLPSLESPPWARGPVVSVAVSNEPATTGTTFCLSDYIGSNAPAFSPALSRKQAPGPKPKGWGAPKGAPVSSGVPTNLVSIQQDELAFKEKQEHTFRDKGRWFVQDREKAASLKEIQELAEKQRAHREFVEQQILIEKQIMKELELQKRAEQKISNRKPRRAKNQRLHDSKKQDTKPLPSNA